jgi:transcriptional regulator with XRE-family HTH domain
MQKKNTSAKDMYCRIIQVMELIFAGSQRQLAEAVHMSPAMISRVVSGKRDPSKRLIKAISQLPEVNADWLLTGNGDPVNTQYRVQLQFTAEQYKLVKTAALLSLHNNVQEYAMMALLMQSEKIVSNRWRL